MNWFKNKNNRDVSNPDVLKKHPVELTLEEINSMTLDELSEFRNKSMKLLEEGLDRLSNKKKEQDLVLNDAVEIISKTCLGLHRRIEVLEMYVKELIAEKAYDEIDDSPQPEEKLNCINLKIKEY